MTKTDTDKQGVSTLFCTPEQGQRLKELVPELRYHYEYFLCEVTGWSPTPFPKGYILTPDTKLAPALTLQEVRDLAKSQKIEDDDWSFVELSSRIFAHTAPELAEWVIARLEESK